jgi:hypothetical protein
MKLFRFRNLRNFLTDVKNYVILRNVIRKNKGTADWERFNLRTDWVGRIYTVFNPNPADAGDDKQMLDIKLGERMIPCHKYVDGIGLSEVVGVSGEKIPDTDSYLIVYYPIFKYLSVWKAVLNSFYIILILIFRSEIVSAANWVITQITSIIP